MQMWWGTKCGAQASQRCPHTQQASTTTCALPHFGCQMFWCRCCCCVAPNADAPPTMQGCSLEVMDIEQAQKEGLKVEITCRQNGPQRRVSAWRPVLVPYIAPAEGSDWHPPTCMHDCLAASGSSETGALQLAPIASPPEMGVCLLLQTTRLRAWTHRLEVLQVPEDREVRHYEMWCCGACAIALYLTLCPCRCLASFPWGTCGMFLHYKAIHCCGANFISCFSCPMRCVL